MDRKSIQKIGYIVWISAAVVTVAVIFIGGINHGNKIRAEQLRELIVIYPEIEGELKDNYIYYQGRVEHMELILMAAAIFFTVFFCCGLIIMKNREIRLAASEHDKEYDLIYEQLLRFHKGNFELLPALKEIGVSGKLENVREELRGLCYYFSDLKTRLMEEENRTKSLITDISHQLKTPLASIRMCHELAKSSELSEMEQKEYQSTESQEIKKMEILLDELVKLSRLENHMIQIKPRKNSLKETISEAVSQVFMKAREKNIEICVYMEKDAEIMHERKWTVEALVNILENAVKYSEPMTTVNVRISYLPTAVLIEVEDEGIGIPEDELHDIFKRFYRGNRARRLVKEGAGVGLYLARNIIEQQGGTIVAKRKSVRGTVFKITFPV